MFYVIIFIVFSFFIGSVIGSFLTRHKGEKLHIWRSFREYQEGNIPIFVLLYNSFLNTLYGGVLLGIIVIYFNYSNSEEKTSSSNVSSSHESSSSTNNDDDPQKYAIGVWQSTIPGEFWEKFEIFENGEFKHWETYPASGNWGEIKDNGNWEIIKDRFVDTGKEYYAIKCKVKGDDDGFYYTIIMKNGILTYGGNGETVFSINKTDKNPWE